MILDLPHDENSEPKRTDVPAPIGPGSILWEYGGDRRISFTGLSAGVLQLMHPEIGAGVAEHSNFFNEPWERIYRSVPQIIGAIYDPDAEQTAKRVRDIHKDIKGTDHQGRSYHALHPESFWWAHATFHNMVEETIDRFSVQELTEPAREQLYSETTSWFNRYGVSGRAAPETYGEFRQKWETTCDETLEMTPAAERAINMALCSEITRMPEIPKPLWPLARPPVADFVKLITIGGLPETVRERFDIPWSRIVDAPRLNLFEKFVRNNWRFLPKHFRYHQRARDGNRIAKQNLLSVEIAE